MTTLFTPLTISNIPLSHRIIMAPLTRFRASDTHTQLPMSVEYYTQRASSPGTLIITESSLISPSHGGVPNAPGLWNDEQIAAWKSVVDAVHAKGCYMICQLLAPGRAADAATLQREAGHRLLSSSAIPLTPDSAVPEPMTEAQIHSAITDYVHAAQNAMRAGFDGVEIHGGNGYLLDQFLQDTCNQRTDRWGGSIENRARFAVEVAAAIADAIGGDKLGYRISPWSEFQGMRMADPIPTFSYLIQKLKDLGLGYLHVIESRVNNNVDVEKTEGIEFGLEVWGRERAVLVAGGFTPESARHAVDGEYRGYNVGVVFGRHFLANPDLVFRVRYGIELNKYDRGSFYTPMMERGYTDYPFSEEFLEREG